MPNLDLAKKWLIIAEEDFEMSLIARDKRKLLYAAFHLQQCQEKVLKGIFVYHDLGQPPYVHDLSRLADALKPAFHIEDRFYAFFAALNPFYIRARYPDYKKFVEKSLDESGIDALIDTGKETLQWLQTLCK
jgi:HEPN domain-containing protein